MKRTYLVVGAILALALAWAATSLLSRGSGADLASPAQASGGEQEVSGVAPADLEAHREAVEAEPAASEPPPPAEGGAPEDEVPDFEPSELPGWYVWGQVRSEQGEPVPRPDLRIQFERHEPGPRVRTRRGGRYEAFLPLPTALSSLSSSDSVPGHIEIEAQAMGYRAQTQRVEEPLPSPFGTELASRILRVDFALETAPRLRGRVLAADGTPVPGAVVDVRFRDQGWQWGGGAFWDEIWGRQTDSEGFFAVPVEQGGEAHVNAMKFGEGTGSIGPIPVDASRDTVAPDLHLAGAGEISGSVVYPDGSAVRDMAVYAIRKDIREELPVGIFSDEALPSNLLEGAQGLPYGFDTTGVDGRFRIGGLAPGTLVFRLEDWFSEDLGEECETGATDVRLEYGGYRLGVTIRDQDGSPVRDADVAWDMSPLGAPPMGAGSPRGGWLYIQPGEVWVKAEKDGRRDWRLVRIPEGQYETEVELRLSTPEAARMLLSVAGPEGESIGDVQVHLRYESTIYRAHHGRLSELEGRPGTYSMEASPGRFDLEVEPFDFCYAGAELRGVEIDPEREDPIEVRLERGGRLRLTVRLMGSQGERPVHLLELWGDGRQLSPRLFFTDPRRPDEAGPRAGTSRIRTGLAFTSSRKPLLPGSYRLKLGVDGYAPSEASFQVTAGEISEVEVWLSPE